LTTGSFGWRLQGGEVDDPGTINAVNAVQEGGVLSTVKDQEASVEFVCEVDPGLIGRRRIMRRGDHHHCWQPWGLRLMGPAGGRHRPERTIVKGRGRWLPIVEEWGDGAELGISIACHVPVSDGWIIDASDGLEGIYLCGICAIRCADGAYPPRMSMTRSAATRQAGHWRGSANT
jgi:hypothetical protein